MAKLISEFLNFNNKKNENHRKTFFLDDILDNDPSKICPECDSSKVVMLTGLHDPDAYHYKCNKCGQEYKIILYKRAEADPH